PAPVRTGTWRARTRPRHDRGAAAHGGPGSAGLRPDGTALRAGAGHPARDFGRTPGAAAGADEPRRGARRLPYRDRRAPKGAGDDDAMTAGASVDQTDRDA